MSGLKCGVPGCKTVIHAMTGFQEVEKLRLHLKRGHALTCSLAGALEWRIRFEEQADEAARKVGAP